MSTGPTFYPPLTPGVCDALVPYTFCLLARGASAISVEAGSNNNSSFALGTYGGGTGVGSILLEALDDPGNPGNAPGDMAVRGQMICAVPISGANQTFAVAFAATDNLGNTVTAVQNFVCRGWTNLTGDAGFGFDGAPTMTFPTGGGIVSTLTFARTAHGLGIGDRVYLRSTGGSSAGAYFWVVTAVPDVNHFTAQSVSVALGGGLVDTNTPATVYLLGTQSGRTQNDITSAGEAAGTWGEAMTPYTIVTDGASIPYAQGVPDGIGLSAGVLSGTPVAFGWYPVTLIAGTMQRLCLFSIAPGTYSTVLVAPSNVTVTAGNTAVAVVTAPSLAGLTVNWSVGNAPSGISITGSSATLATISGVFSSPGSYPLLVVATASNGMVVSTIITFTVLGGAPVVSAPTTTTFTTPQGMAIQMYATGNPTGWTLASAPGWMAISANGLITGTPPAAGVYGVVVTAANGAGTSDPTLFQVTISDPSEYLDWLDDNPLLLDLQFDLRMRLVTSYYSTGTAGAAAVITLMQSDTCTLALVLSNPGLVTDATGIWITGQQLEDNSPVININVASPAAALTAVGANSYYSIPLNLSGDLITQAFDDMNAPTDGTPRILKLQCQVCVQRSVQVARSQPFTLNIIQRIAQGPAPADNP